MHHEIYNLSPSKCHMITKCFLSVYRILGMFVLKVQFSMNCYVKQISQNHHFYYYWHYLFLRALLEANHIKKRKIVGSKSKLLQLFDAAVTFIIWS